MGDSPMSWLSELGMEESMFIHQCDIMDSFEEELAAALGEDFQHSECNSSSTNPIPISFSTTNLHASSSMEALPVLADVERPSKQHKPNNYNSCTTNVNNNIASLDHDLQVAVAASASASSSGFILSFGNSNLSENPQQVPLGTMSLEDEVVSSFLLSQGNSLVNLEDGTKSNNSQGTKKASTPRPPSQTYDHIIAERKRRELLSQRFVALSGIVPGLKKMDKTSVLGETIKYLKQLQERVKILEEQATKQTMESVVLVKKSQLVLEDEDCSSDESSTTSEPLPEIEARVCNKNALLRIHCERHKGVLVKVLAEMEKLNLGIINMCVAPFGSLALDITIIAKMETESCMTVKDLVKNLRPALQHFM